MSDNPVATIGNSIPTPSDPSLVRKTYTLVQFDAQDFYGYNVGEKGSFSPSGQGDSFIMTVPLADTLTPGPPAPPSLPPTFCSAATWENMKLFPSMFVSGAWNSIMPKIITPSTILVDNGINSSGAATSKWLARPMADLTKELFNWTIVTVNGAAVAAADYAKYVGTAGNAGSQYCVTKAKDDTKDDNVIVLELNNTTVPADNRPTGNWDETSLVVGGAFVLMLNVTPLRPAGADPNKVQENAWTVKIVFGEVTMILDQTGSLNVVLGGDAVNQKASLVEGKAKQGPPQQEHFNDKPPYVITVYPVWNGLVVSCGLSDATSSLAPTSQFIMKTRDASIKLPPYSNWFDPTAPANVVIDGSLAAVKVDFGTKMTLTASQCRIDWAYLPCFFSREGWFDDFFIVNDDNPGDVGYTYKVYSIYTLNGTGYTVAETMSNTGIAGTSPDTHYQLDEWVMSYPDPPKDRFLRYGPQVFAAILETTETRQFPIKNGNGNFNLVWTGGTAGDPATTNDWRDYIQNISVTIGQDGSSGSITVDKHGVAGQTAEAIQSIGAVTVSASGGEGTVDGSIFQGLAMGIAENLTSEGASWTVPMIGLEKKMEDIALINVPFFDGRPMSTAVDFLCRYAGINYDLSAAPNSPIDLLGISEDLNVPRFDWRSGTSVKTALEDVMNDVGYSYVVRDGVVYVYERDATGLPLYPGPDRNPGGLTYPNTKVTTIDRTPDFDDIRNELVAVAMQGVDAGQGTKYATVPMVPIVAAMSLTTVPDIPWAKSLVDPLPGFMTITTLNNYLANREKPMRTYLIAGKTTIPGNADIKPYDRWNGYIIVSVTHNLDFANKTWTTDIELFWHG